MHACIKLRVHALDDWFLYHGPFPVARLTHRPDDGGSKDFWNVGKLLPDYTVLQPRRQQSSWAFLGQTGHNRLAVFRNKWQTTSVTDNNIFRLQMLYWKVAVFYKYKYMKIWTLQTVQQINNSTWCWDYKTALNNYLTAVSTMFELGVLSARSQPCRAPIKIDPSVSLSFCTHEINRELVNKFRSILKSQYFTKNCPAIWNWIWIGRFWRPFHLSELVSVWLQMILWLPRFPGEGNPPWWRHPGTYPAHVKAIDSRQLWRDWRHLQEVKGEIVVNASELLRCAYSSWLVNTEFASACRKTQVCFTPVSWLHMPQHQCYESCFPLAVINILFAI
jgi:hypothetical protein